MTRIVYMNKAELENIRILCANCVHSETICVLKLCKLENGDEAKTAKVSLPNVAEKLR